MVAIGDYKGQFSDELSFKTGDKLEVTLDGKLVEHVLAIMSTHHTTMLAHTHTPVSDDWYEGKFQGKTGIFPKTYVKDTA